MKKSILIISCCIIFAMPANISHAQEVNPSEPAHAYRDLSYPGLLPDHPLYFLKVARDNVLGFFKGDPIDRANYDLIQSEEYVAASYVLLSQEQKDGLAYASFEQAQYYLEDAIKHADVAKKEGVDIGEISQKIKAAQKKHSLFINKHDSHQQKNQEQFTRVKQRAEHLRTMTSETLQ